MSYTDDDLLPLSALQHFIFCRRQCALIHIEQAWEENLFTAQGRVLHDKAHEGGIENREGVRIERGVAMRSLKLGLVGVADVVEFRQARDGTWAPFPVEYKRGKPKKDDCDKVQLCAQALCLEEMLDKNITEGALFYGKTRRRLAVPLDGCLRARTADTARQLHELIDAGITPKAVYEKKCDTCSLLGLCLPRIKGKVMGYITDSLELLH